MNDATRCTGKTARPWRAHTTTHDWYKCEWGSNEVVKQTKSYAVIMPGDTPAETVLVCEINDTDRNPWGFPVDPYQCATLIAAAPDLLATLERALPLVQLLGAKMNGPEQVEDTVRAILTVLAKAKGEQKTI